MQATSENKCQLVIVEGNISAGKSTLCKQLAERLGYCLYLEPTVENPFLEKYYAEPKQYALPMQLWLLKQRYVTFINAIKFVMEKGGSTAGVVLDRSIFSDIVFAEKNFEDGNFTKDGYDYYLHLREQLLAGLPLPHAMVYLDTTPQVCFDRIHNMRQRDCEDGIPLDYLAGLDACYLRLVERMRAESCPTIVVDWNDFGQADQVVRELATVPIVPVHEWAGDEAALKRFIADVDAVHRRMIVSDLPLPADAAGCDVAVADPDVITAAESADMVMPSSSTAESDSEDAMDGLSVPSSPVAAAAATPVQRAEAGWGSEQPTPAAQSATSDKMGFEDAACSKKRRSLYTTPSGEAKRPSRGVVDAADEVSPMAVTDLWR